jgi:hypothetical protein
MDREQQVIHNFWLKHGRWRDPGIGKKIILKWILNSPLLECDLDLLVSGLEQMAGYCAEYKAYSVPQKSREYLEQQSDYLPHTKDSALWNYCSSMLTVVTRPLSVQSD